MPDRSVSTLTLYIDINLINNIDIDRLSAAADGPSFGMTQIFMSSAHSEQARLKDETNRIVRSTDDV